MAARTTPSRKSIALSESSAAASTLSENGPGTEERREEEAGDLEILHFGDYISLFNPDHRGYVNSNLSA